MNLALDAIHRRAIAQARVDTPLGTLLLARTASGLAGAWFEGQQHHPGVLGAPQASQDTLLLRTSELLQQYFDGRPVVFDVALDLQGTPFQRTVWLALLRIPMGQTRSYGAIAQRLGMPNAVRAVGAAIGRNPLSIIVPCHRVVGRDGSLTGYAGGLERKRALLALEAVRMVVA